MKNNYGSMPIKIISFIAFAMIATACNPFVVKPPENTIAYTATSTSIPVNTITPTVTEAQALLPTLSAEDAEKLAFELLKTQTDCKLSCWWSLTPGVSTAQEAQLIFEMFPNTIVDESSYKFTVGDGYFSMRPLSSGIELGIQYFTENGPVSVIYVKTKMVEDVYNVTYNDIGYQKIMSMYTLKAVLNEYGKPNQVFVRSFSGLAREFNPTQVLLYYPDKGIIAQYFSPNGLARENDVFVIPTCPPKSHISLRLFDPASKPNLEELLKIDDSFTKYKEISEVTNMNIDTFYDAYREYDEELLESGCPATLKTQEDIWPNIYSNP